MHVIRPSKKISSIFAFVGILLLLTGIVCMVDNVEFFKGVDSYKQLGFHRNLEGIVLKITYYNFVSIICILFDNLFTNRHSLFSYLGKHTLPIYIVHICIILGNKYTNNFITELKPLTFRLGVVHQTNNPSDQQFTF